VSTTRTLRFWGAVHKANRHLLSPGEISQLESIKGWTWRLTKRENSLLKEILATKEYSWCDRKVALQGMLISINPNAYRRFERKAKAMFNGARQKA